MGKSVQQDPSQQRWILELHLPDLLRHVGWKIVHLQVHGFKGDFADGIGHDVDVKTPKNERPGAAPVNTANPDCGGSGRQVYSLRGVPSSNL
jgi:hypothetical protein